MLTVVLADDDCLVTEILHESIPWAELGMQVVGIADHGKKALDLCLDLRPDILVTDIQMPFCNGLEVALELMEQDIPTKIILISGVQDFDYARLALNVKAAGYILKPIQLKEVISVLKKARDAIEMEFQREQVIQRLTSQLSENMSLMRDKFLTNLIVEGMESDDELQERLVYFNLPFAITQDITVAVAKMDEYEHRVRKEGVERVQFFNFSIRNIIEQTLNNFQAGICFSTKDNEFVIIFGEEYGSEEKMNQIFEGIEHLLINFGDISLSIGIGNCVSVKKANLSYSCACSAISYKFYTGSNSIIHINDIS
ncbi:response regulator [Paenibacillus qinlingensis]|uniref:response regulator n=1 Tax=Paenibacillus qinlingensis TaxID=1837343 RepID=UPI00156799AD|nr:response regulator [Paenibacillus qinlingensis]NQX61037.1 response regulator [Paenibacillus qinlingensis]